jgi:hypothetical protein
VSGGWRAAECFEFGVSFGGPVWEPEQGGGALEVGVDGFPQPDGFGEQFGRVEQPTLGARARQAAAAQRFSFFDRRGCLDEKVLGGAIFPISVSMAFVTLSTMSGLACTPGLSATYISTPRPRTSSMTGTAAASATSHSLEEPAAGIAALGRLHRRRPRRSRR